ncbi:MAG: thiamine pyrophosphate-dependent enzyme, partial [Microbacteriaceae bacterium]|nr:thiamine pyrophosphate-dependent enzyme [Microbacteriaceae bacterium]
RSMRGDLSGRLASMLASMPYALAAKFAYPERPVICTIGDGAFQMLGMNELITAKKYLERWPDKRFIVAIMHNDDLAQVSWEARTQDADPVWRSAQDVESIDYAGYAELLGFRGVRVRSDDEIAGAWDAALAHDGVTVLDCYVTRNAPPLPPKITKEYRDNTLKVLAKDDPLRVNAVIDSAEAIGAAALQRARNVLHLGDRDERGGGQAG